MRRERLFLTDIIGAAEAVARFLQGVDRDIFLGSELLQSAVLQKLIVVGEAATHIDPVTRARAPDVRWRSTVGFQNMVVHGYFNVDWEIAWEAVVTDLPILRAQISALLATLPADE